MRTTIARHGGRDVLVCAPNWRQFGHLALEMLLAYAEARETGMPVYFVRSAQAANVALFEIEPKDLPVLHPSAFDRWRLKLALERQDLSERLRLLSHRAAEELRTEVRSELSRWHDKPEMPRDVSARIKHAKGYLKDPFFWELPRLHVNDRQHYYNRRLLRDPVPVQLSARAREEAVRQAAAIGIDERARIVTVHAREAGYKFGREMQDTKPDSARDDSTRNTRIESYFAAMDYLVERGFTVVRIGDPSMTPVQRRGVIDLATAPQRTPLLEIHCLMRSHLLLGSDSGPSAVAYLTNTPLVCLNCTDPIASYPVRTNTMYTVKAVADRRTGRPLTLRQMLELEYATNSRNSRLYRYYDNTPEEVLEAVREMLDMLEGRTEMSAAQQEYKEAVLRADAALRPLSNYIRKWGADHGFIGEGRISRYFAERHL